MSAELIDAIRALIESIQAEEHRSGGLLSRETLRLAALLYQAVLEERPQ